MACLLTLISLFGIDRYARRQGFKTIEGHDRGFKSLMEVLRCCLVFDIKCVTVYAFSVENFNRPDHEVQGLMDLAADKFEELHTHRFLPLSYSNFRLLLSSSIRIVTFRLNDDG